MCHTTATAIANQPPHTHLRLYERKSGAEGMLCYIVGSLMVKSTHVLVWQEIYNAWTQGGGNFVEFNIFTDELLLDTESRMWDVSEWIHGWVGVWIHSWYSVGICWSFTIQLTYLEIHFWTSMPKSSKTSRDFMTFYPHRVSLLFHINYNLLIESYKKDVFWNSYHPDWRQVSDNYKRSSGRYCAMSNGLTINPRKT